MTRTSQAFLIAAFASGCGAMVGAYGTYYLLEGRSESVILANRVHVAEILFASGSEADAKQAQLDLLALTSGLREDGSIDEWQIGVAELEARLRLATLSESKREHIVAAQASCEFAGMKACDESSLNAIQQRLASQRETGE